jgi:hypothetical protein
MPSRLPKILRLPRYDRWLLSEALLAVAVIRLCLWLLPFGTARRIVDSIARRDARGPAAAAEVAVDRVVWAVRAASARVPRATCLTQALATRLMLERRGLPALLRIGVGRSAEKGVEGHAWIECQGKIVIGEADPGRYTTLETP